MGLELIYFPCFGRGGVTKILLKLANVDFKDTIVDWDKTETGEIWAEQKKGIFFTQKIPGTQFPGKAGNFPSRPVPFFLIFP